MINIHAICINIMAPEKRKAFKLFVMACAALWIKLRTLGMLPWSQWVTSPWNYVFQGLKESPHQLRSPCPARLSFRIQKDKGLLWTLTQHGRRGLKEFYTSKRRGENHSHERMGSKSQWKQESNIINPTSFPPLRAQEDSVWYGMAQYLLLLKDS